MQWSQLRGISDLELLLHLLLPVLDPHQSHIPASCAASSPPCLSPLLILELRWKEPTFNAGKASLWGPFVSGINESHLSGQQSSKGARTPCPAHSSSCQSPAGAHKPLKWSLRVQGGTETGTGALGPLASGIYPRADEQAGIRAGSTSTTEPLPCTAAELRDPSSCTGMGFSVAMAMEIRVHWAPHAHSSSSEGLAPHPSTGSSGGTEFFGALPSDTVTHTGQGLRTHRVWLLCPDNAFVVY